VFKCVKYHINRSEEQATLKNSNYYIKARVTSEKNYLPNSPVSHDFTYYYQFTINGVVYKASSGASKDLAIGDSILVRYVKTNPNLNEPASHH
jgi:hypothetical protein